MTRVVNDDCGDHYNTTDMGMEWYIPGRGAIVDSDSGKGVRVGDDGAPTNKLIPGSPYDELYIGCRLKFSAVADGYMHRTGIYLVDGGSNKTVFMSAKGDGSLILYDATNAIVATSAPGVVIPATSAYYELHCVRSAVAGSVEIKKAGSVVLTATGLNTGLLGWEIFGGSGPDLTLIVDDLYINTTAGAHSNGYEGDQVMYFQITASDDTAQDWDFHGAGAAWQAVNTASPSVTPANYISVDDSSLPSTSRFGLAALPGSATTILCVTPVFAANTDIGGTTAVNAVMHNGSGDQAGTSVALSTTPALYHPDHYSISPISGIAWTASELNGLKLGVERTA